MKRVVRNAKAAKRAKPEELSGAWATLRDRLAEALGVLEEGQYLVLQGARSPYYVQFAMEADSLLWAEAVSDAFLPKGHDRGDAAASVYRGGAQRETDLCQLEHRSDALRACPPLRGRLGNGSPPNPFWLPRR